MSSRGFLRAALIKMYNVSRRNIRIMYYHVSRTIPASDSPTKQFVIRLDRIPNSFLNLT